MVGSKAFVDGLIDGVKIPYHIATGALNKPASKDFYNYSSTEQRNWGIGVIAGSFIEGVLIAGGIIVAFEYFTKIL